MQEFCMVAGYMKISNIKELSTGVWLNWNTMCTGVIELAMLSVLLSVLKLIKKSEPPLTDLFERTPFLLHYAQQTGPGGRSFSKVG